MKAWNRAITAALEAVDAEEECPGDPSPDQLATMNKAGVVDVARASVRATKEAIRQRIGRLLTDHKSGD
jgi:hypothetical protein